MGLRINTNVQSLRAQNSLAKVEENKSNTLAKLSSGSRINKAGDDAAGLAISEKLKANQTLLSSQNWDQVFSHSL